MQRHGLAFCLGLLMTGLAAAQPPADGERYPPPPHLPGVVVGKTTVGKPTNPSPPKVVSVQAGEPAPTPRSLDGDPIPAGPSVTATTEPVEDAAAKPELPAPEEKKAVVKEKKCKDAGCSCTCVE